MGARCIVTSHDRGLTILSRLAERCNHDAVPIVVLYGEFTQEKPVKPAVIGLHCAPKKEEKKKKLSLRDTLRLPADELRPSPHPGA
jgi:hypothetical protein